MPSVITGGDNERRSTLPAPQSRRRRSNRISSHALSKFSQHLVDPPIGYRGHNAPALAQALMLKILIAALNV